MEYNLLPEITSLYKTNQWQEMLKLSENGKSEDLRNFMWVWPSQRNLRFIAKKILDNHLDGIMSIGCGCGLFEWILQESTSKIFYQ